MRLPFLPPLRHLSNPSVHVGNVPPRQRFPRQKRRKRPVFTLLFLLLLGGIATKHLHRYWHTPQAILVLGGATEREVFAAEFAQQHPDLEIWVSSGSNPEFAEWNFAEAGIDGDRIHLDYRAVDTVTNFTTLVDDFEAAGIKNIYLITSDYHMRRARIIGEIVLGSRGISYRPVPVPSEQVPESLDKSVRDAARAILWVTTGRTGLELLEYLPSHAQAKRLNE